MHEVDALFQGVGKESIDEDRTTSLILSYFNQKGRYQKLKKYNLEFNILFRQLSLEHRKQIHHHFQSIPELAALFAHSTEYQKSMQGETAPVLEIWLNKEEFEADWNQNGFSLKHFEIRVGVFCLSFREKSTRKVYDFRILCTEDGLEIWDYHGFPPGLEHIRLILEQKISSTPRLRLKSVLGQYKIIIIQDIEYF